MAERQNARPFLQLALVHGVAEVLAALDQRPPRPTAQSCPHCGRPLRRPCPRSGFQGWVCVCGYSCLEG